MAISERRVIDLITVDFSEGQDALMEGILDSCLAVIGGDSDDGWTEISDDELEMLSAAGAMLPTDETQGDSPIR